MTDATIAIKNDRQNQYNNDVLSIFDPCPCETIATHVDTEAVYHSDFLYLRVCVFQRDLRAKSTVNFQQSNLTLTRRRSKAVAVLRDFGQ